MNQATLIVGAILTAFIAYVAVKGRLGVYYNIVVGSAGSSGSSGSSGGTAAPNYIIPPVPGLGFPGVTG